MSTIMNSKRGFRPIRGPDEIVCYPDLEESSRGRWIKYIAGAMTGAALMAFVVSCNEDGGMTGPPSPYDLAVEAAIDLEVATDSGAPDVGMQDPDSGKMVDAGSNPKDTGE